MRRVTGCPTGSARRLAQAALTASALLWPQGNADAALDGSCTISVTRQGTMMVNPTIDVLASKQSGGQSAEASVDIDPGLIGLTCTLIQWINCFALTTTSPASFSNAPAGYSTGSSFVSVFRVDGSPVERPENIPFTVLNGLHMVNIELTATRNTGVFASGSYQAVVTLRCE